MKILILFIDMVRLDHLKLFNNNVHTETSLDRLFNEIGGTLYTNCYSPAPDTPRSNACFQSGLYPYFNGCDIRIKWPRYFMKDEITTIWDNAVERGYSVNLCDNYNSVETGFFKYKKNDRIKECYTLDDIAKCFNYTDNNISFIGNPDCHHAICDYDSSHYGIKKGFEALDVYFHKYVTPEYMDTFDYVFFYSDHGMECLEESIYKRTKLDLLNNGRSQILMFCHKKGDKGVVKDDRLASMVDLYATLEKLTGGDDLRHGYNLLEPSARDMIFVEDHTNFAVAPEVMIKQWRVKTKTFDIRTDIYHTIDENGNEADPALVEDILNKYSPTYTSLKKQYKVWAYYNELKKISPNYFVGTRRNPHMTLWRMWRGIKKKIICPLLKPFK